MADLTLPTHMSEEDHIFFKYCINKRFEHLLAAMAGVDIDLIIGFLRSAGGDKDALDQLKAVSVGINGLVKTYSLGKLDVVQEDQLIVRKPDPSVLIPDAIIAAEVADHLNGHTPEPMLSRAQRRHKDD